MKRLLSLIIALALVCTATPISSVRAASYTIMDTAEEAEGYLSWTSAFSVYGDYYFLNGVRQKYTSEAQRPILHENGWIYVSDAFLALLGYGTITITNGVKVTVGGFDLTGTTYTVDGIVHVPLKLLVENKGKTMTFDQRGFFVISNGAFAYTDGENFTDMFEPADVIYRYLQFENPTGAKMLSDFKSNAPMHPRILYTQEDITYINSQTSDKWLAATKRARDIAEDITLRDLGSSLSSSCADADKQSQAVHFQSLIESLATGYLVSGDARYAAKGIEYMQRLCAWDDLAYDVSNLVTGHWAMGMAIGYDSFYSAMTAEQKQTVKSAVLNLAFADTIQYYTTEGAWNQPHWMKICDNFSGVIGGGMMALTLAFADEADLQYEIQYLLENIIKTNEIAVSLFNADGGYFEGLEYSRYMLQNLTIGIEALFKCCGSDYGLGSVQGFSDAGSFFVYLQGEKNMLNFHDCSQEIIYTYLPCWFAMRYGKTQYARLMNEKLDRNNEILPLLGLLYYSKAEQTQATDVPLDKYYKVAEAGSFRSGFGTNPTFVGFHGGRTNLTHDMLDLGEFVFESDGVPWVIDLGKDDYNLSNYFAQDGYKYYRKRTEGENCVVINPSKVSDSYYGQALNAWAHLENFETADRAAKASYDLTSAYQRDVTSYKRGYYFADDRNTLLVQDEIELKGSSELYWFMNTKADIQIISKNEALLSYGGKTLRAQVYCNAANFSLSSMAASPLSTSPTPPQSGQNTNSGVRKLTIHTQGATGKLVFAVKLIPESDYFDAPSLSLTSYTPISEWTLPQGSIDYKTIITDATVSDAGMLSAAIQLPKQTSNIKILIDGNERAAYAPEAVGPSTINLDVSDLSAGEHEILIEADKGSTTEKASARFLKNNVIKTVLMQKNMKNYQGYHENFSNGWYLEPYGNGSRDSESYLLTSPSSAALAVAYRTDVNEKAISDGIFECECDIKLSSQSGHMEFECSSTGGFFLYDNKKLIDNGVFADGSTCEANKWYKVKLIIDTAAHTCSTYVRDSESDYRPLFENFETALATSVKACKIQYTQSGGNTIYYKNMVFRNYKQSDMAYMSCEKTGDTVRATLKMTDSTMLTGEDILLIIASYEDNRLVDVSMKEVQGATAEGEYITLNEANGTQYIKSFVISKAIKPLGKMAYRTVMTN